MTEPNQASQLEETVVENGSGVSPPESKNAVTDSGKKENELKIDEQANDGDVTTEVKENKHNSENGTAVEASEEVGDEKRAEDNNKAEAEDANMVEVDSVKVNDDTKSVEPDCGMTVDGHAQKIGTTEDRKTADTENAKEEDAEDSEAVDAQDIQAGTTKDGKDVNMEDVSKVYSEGSKGVNADDAEPMDAEDAKPSDAAGIKLANTEDVKDDDVKDEDGGKVAEEDGSEEERGININKERGSESKEKKVDLDRPEDSKKKRPRGQKDSPNRSQKEKKDSAKKDKELQSTPVTSTERPVRERKTVERLLEVILKEPNREFHVEKGRGTPLKNIPNVAYKLARKKPADIKLIHQTLFGRRGKAVDFKSHILQFSGFVWHESDEKQKSKMKEKLDKYVKDTLVDLCDLFDLSVSRANSKKEDLVTKLLDFLVVPHASTDVLLADKDQEKSRKRKRVAKGNASKSLGSPPGKGLKGKRTKSEDTPNRKGKSVESEDDDEDDNSIGSSDEEKSPKYSDSEVKESEPEESEKEDTDDEEKSVKGKAVKKKVSKKSGSIGKMSKVRLSPKKSLISSSKSPKASSVTSSKSKDDNDVGTKVFSRKTKNVGSPVKRSTPKSDSKEKDAGKKLAKVKAKSVEVGHPTKEELRSKICEILKEVDFNTATFTDILKRLAAYYKMDLTPRKASLKLMIQDELTRLANEADEDEDDKDEE